MEKKKKISIIVLIFVVVLAIVSWIVALKIYFSYQGQGGLMDYLFHKEPPSIWYGCDETKNEACKYME